MRLWCAFYFLSEPRDTAQFVWGHEYAGGDPSCSETFSSLRKWGPPLYSLKRRTFFLKPWKHTKCIWVKRLLVPRGNLADKRCPSESEQTPQPGFLPPIGWWMFYEFLGLAFSNIIQAVVRTNTHNLCIQPWKREREENSHRSQMMMLCPWPNTQGSKFTVKMLRFLRSLSSLLGSLATAHLLSVTIDCVHLLQFYVSGISMWVLPLNMIILGFILIVCQLLLLFITSVTL